MTAIVVLAALLLVGMIALFLAIYTTRNQPASEAEELLESARRAELARETRAGR